MKRLLWLDEVDKDSLPEVGDKNASLGELLRAGMRVPPGFAVTTECVFDAEKGGIVYRDISSDRCNMPRIADDEEVFELAKIGKRIEKHHGCFQDIECAMDKDMEFPNNIFIVQSLPETVWGQRSKGPVADKKSGLDLIMEKALSFRGKSSRQSWLFFFTPRAQSGWLCGHSRWKISQYKGADGFMSDMHFKSFISYSVVLPV